MKVEKKQVLFVPKTKAQAKKWLRLCVYFCAGGFHPDTPASDYVNEDNKQTFNKTESKVFEAARDRVFKLLKDPYKDGLAYVDEMNAKRAEL